MVSVCRGIGMILCMVLPVSGISESIYNRMKTEEAYYYVSWMGMTVGTIRLVARVDRENGFILSNASVTSFDSLKGLYYVGGFFGTKWNYRENRPFYSYEEVYQGKIYQKRVFYFGKNVVKVKIHKKKFPDYGYPHDPPVKEKRIEKTIHAPGYMDLLGSFYYMRLSGHSPKIREKKMIRILPSGNKRLLVVKVLRREVIDTASWGKTKVFVVQTGILNPAKKIQEGGDIFFSTKSKITMWITDDAYFLPVRMQTNVEYLGSVTIYLGRYRKL